MDDFEGFACRDWNLALLPDGRILLDMAHSGSSTREETVAILLTTEQARHLANALDAVALAAEPPPRRRN